MEDIQHLWGDSILVGDPKLTLADPTRPSIENTLTRVRAYCSRLFTGRVG
jgi:hypothetical protein